jgi:hypothetical protein
VSAALLVDADTVRDYFKRYEQGGLAGLLRMSYAGAEALLDTEQLRELDAHLVSGGPNPRKNGGLTGVGGGCPEVGLVMRRGHPSGAGQKGRGSSGAKRSGWEKSCLVMCSRAQSSWMRRP